MDTTLVEATVTTGGRTARRVKAAGPSPRAPKTTYRLSGDVVLPDPARELVLADTILLACSRLGEASRDEVLREAGAVHSGGERAFAALVHLGLVVRVGRATNVHPGAVRRMDRCPRIVVTGTVRRISGTHPAKRRVHLDLSDGRRAEARCYGETAVIAARISPGAEVRVTGLQLSGQRLQLRASEVCVLD